MSRTATPPPLDALRAFFRDRKPGPVTDPSSVESAERLLAEAWDALTGDDGGMEAYKLLHRTENMHWQPPILSFAIERHGGTVLGSKYAELQDWTVDVDAATTATSAYSRRKRLLMPLNPRLDTRPIAAELADHIVNGRDDPRLTWRKDRRRVRVRAIAYGEPNLPKETAAGRAKRLRRDLLPLLVPHGWNLGPNGWWEASGGASGKS